MLDRLTFEMLQGKQKVLYMAKGCKLYTVTMFYIPIWPILPLVIHFITSEVSEIDRFGEIFIRIEFSQVVNQL